MQELDKIFVAKNKRALLEEIAMQLSKSRGLIDIASTNPDGIMGALIGLSACVGTIDSYFKQYMLLRKGDIPRTTPAIGFHAFDESDDTLGEYNNTDLDDNDKSQLTRST